MGKGQELYIKAKTIIPGGTQLLSKRPEKFLPNLWPAYYSKAKGCEVWDLDGNHYYDFAQMGVGSCVLGYVNENVNNAVIDTINKSSMCSLNAPEEIELAEKLIELHPWAEMVRYSRTGGEACSIAIRIGRASTGRDKIAFCGYHGWHDWYLSSNLGNSTNLDGQLLPGLDPKGVPRELKNTAFPFNYNQIDELKNIVDNYPNEVGVIIMEPQREVDPEPGFLEEVRAIANKIGAVLIFDEVTSGFRMNNGGIHLLHQVEPDIAVFGKALGNGFPISAIIGKNEVMDVTQDSFISSTFWTERIGFVAALATINEIERNDVPEKLIKYGKMINDGWKEISRNNNINIKINGIPPLTHLSFDYPNSLELQTLYTQEMLGKGYLLGASVYATFAYTEEIINRFIDDSNTAFKKINLAIQSQNVKRFLESSVIQSGLARLTK